MALPPFVIAQTEIHTRSQMLNGFFFVNRFGHIVYQSGPTWKGTNL